MHESKVRHVVCAALRPRNHVIERSSVLHLQLFVKLAGRREAMTAHRAQAALLLHELISPRPRASSRRETDAMPRPSPLPHPNSMKRSQRPGDGDFAAGLVGIRR